MKKRVELYHFSIYFHSYFLRKGILENNRSLGMLIGCRQNVDGQWKKCQSRLEEEARKLRPRPWLVLVSTITTHNSDNLENWDNKQILASEVSLPEHIGWLLFICRYHLLELVLKTMFKTNWQPRDPNLQKLQRMLGSNDIKWCLDSVENIGKQYLFIIEVYSLTVYCF